MKTSYVQLHPLDNVLAALADLKSGTIIELNKKSFQLTENIPAKHKFTVTTLAKNDKIIMYGILIGRATIEIKSGSTITTQNTTHAVEKYTSISKTTTWTVPETHRWKHRTFLGYLRQDGKVGTMNYWLVIPLVFCENRNINVIKEAMLGPLGYKNNKYFSVDTQVLIDAHESGKTSKTLLDIDIIPTNKEIKQKQIFKNVDGIKFLTHNGGCGGTREDSDVLCKLLAGYITHPNVAGATILSLGCQNAQSQTLQSAINNIDSNFSKPVYFIEQQSSSSEREFIADAVKQTFVGLTITNKTKRQPASLNKITLGLECGGSDGFSGISANPALGVVSDILVGLKATTILSEFPELNGVEQELIHRCETQELADKFSNLMQSYSDRADAVGSGFKNNPSPGNIKDGLITDAMKSAGAAKKGGTSPVTDVLDYTEIATKTGLNLLCTPGNDVESTTGLAGSGANIIVFTTGLGTPTGNPICPVIKMSSNNKLFAQMNDTIDINAGTIITGEDTIQSKGEELLEYIIAVASGEQIPASVKLGQDDFIPWKRGVSL